MLKYSDHYKETCLRIPQRVRRNNFCSTFVIKMNAQYFENFSILVDKTGSMVMKLASFFVIYFCSLFLLFVGLDRSQNTKGIEMHTNN